MSLASSKGPEPSIDGANLAGKMTGKWRESMVYNVGYSISLLEKIVKLGDIRCQTVVFIFMSYRDI